MIHKYTLEFEIDDEERYPCLKCPLGETGECLVNDEVNYTASLSEQYEQCPLAESGHVVWLYKEVTE